MLSRIQSWNVYNPFGIPFFPHTKISFKSTILVPLQKNIKSTSERINQSINGSMNHSMDQSINQWLYQSLSGSINQSLDPSISQWINQSIDQTVHWESVQENLSVLVWTDFSFVCKHILGKKHTLLDFCIFCIFLKFEFFCEFFSFFGKFFVRVLFRVLLGVLLILKWILCCLVF